MGIGFVNLLVGLDVFLWMGAVAQEGDWPAIVNP